LNQYSNLDEIDRKDGETDINIMHGGDGSGILVHRGDDLIGFCRTIFTGEDNCWNNYRRDIIAIRMIAYNAPAKEQTLAIFYENIDAECRIDTDVNWDQVKTAFESINVKIDIIGIDLEYSNPLLTSSVRVQTNNLKEAQRTALGNKLRAYHCVTVRFIDPTSIAVTYGEVMPPNTLAFFREGNAILSGTTDGVPDSVYIDPKLKANGINYVTNCVIHELGHAAGTDHCYGPHTKDWEVLEPEREMCVMSYAPHLIGSTTDYLWWDRDLGRHCWGNEYCNMIRRNNRPPWMWAWQYEINYHSFSHKMRMWEHLHWNTHYKPTEFPRKYDYVNWVN